MSIKFNGENKEYINLLNKAFKSSEKGIQIGNVFRFLCYFKKFEYKINLFANGTVQIQPSPPDGLYNFIENTLSENHNIQTFHISDKKIFIVHGHDMNSKMQLENILLKWKLEPYAIQDEDSQGKTIIEFLEGEIKNHSVAIILLTADDIGYSIKDGEEENKKPRSRQNVILELGMLIGAIGRENCIILRQLNVEIPSDIDGLIYISFNENVLEVKDKLQKKLENIMNIQLF